MLAIPYSLANFVLIDDQLKRARKEGRLAEALLDRRAKLKRYAFSALAIYVKLTFSPKRSVLLIYAPHVVHFTPLSHAKPLDVLNLTRDREVVPLRLLACRGLSCLELSLCTLSEG